MLWDANQLPSNNMNNDRCLALPKLNLQFLTIHDYLLRNFKLYRLESAYEIRGDLMDSIKRMTPKEGLRGTTLFGGWSRMALPISLITIGIYLYKFMCLCLYINLCIDLSIYFFCTNFLTIHR